MPLDNPPPPHRVAPDEWVPSCYPLQVGEIDVVVVSDGVLLLPTATMATNADPTARAAWADDMCLPQEAFDWPLNAIVVRTGGRTILVDAGLGAEFPDFPRAGRLALRLEAAGINLASVTDVVLTHMHMDHVGGLLVDGVRDRLRSDLRVHVAAAEVKFWASPNFSRTSMPSPVPDVLRSTAQRFLQEYGSQLQTFNEEYEVAPGVVVCRTGGHTPGHSIVRLASRGDRLTFAGDAVFPVGFDHPDWHNGFEHDPEEATYVRIRLLRELAATREPQGPLTRHSRRYAMCSPPVAPFGGYRLSGTTDRLLHLAKPQGRWRIDLVPRGKGRIDSMRLSNDLNRSYVTPGRYRP